MTEPQAENPTIVLDAKNLAARVVIPKGSDPHALSLHLLLSLARERGVELNPAAEKSLAGVVERFKLSPEPVDLVFLQATPPIHGDAGYIEWRPGFNPDAPGEQEHTAVSDKAVDYYAHQSFVRVRREDHVATIHEPTPGVDGRDVTGRTIPATPGKSLTITIEPSLSKLADGRVIGQLDGLLTYQGKKLRVDPVLEIQGTVDFSTGNIDFDGDVVIHRDIRDKFVVKATQNVTIEGLIDASHIHCGGNLSARRGVAGRGEGTLHVHGDAHIGYLDAVTGHIEGSLYFAREMMHCTMSIGANLTSDVGRVIGGRVTVAGDVRIAELGPSPRPPPPCGSPPSPTTTRPPARPPTRSRPSRNRSPVGGRNSKPSGPTAGPSPPPPPSA